MDGYQQNFPVGPGGQSQQFAPQGLFGSLLGGPVGGLVGRGVGGLFGNPALGSQIGQIAGGIGGGLLPFGVDPITAAYLQQQAQQQQFAPQGFFGNLLGQVGQPLGSAIGGAFGNPQLGSTIGSAAGQIGRMLPFGVDPITAAYLQQQAQQQQAQQQQAQQQQAQQQQAQQPQFAPQGFFGNLLGQIGQPLGSAIGGAFGNPQLGSTIGGAAGQIGRMLPFGVDPITAAYLQQQAQQQQTQQPQFAPQGFFGNLLGQIGQPLGGAIGGAFGNPQLGSTIGGAAGQLGRMLPFGADPISAAYAQQAQQAQLSPQGFFGNLIGQIGQPLGGAIGGAFGNPQLGSTIGSAAGQLGRMLPFNVDPYTAAAYAQQQALQAQLAQQAQQAQQGQQQISPQGFFGNLLGQVGQPLGGAIGSMFGNSQLGSTIGGAAGQIGRMLPFNIDPYTAAAYAQQQQAGGYPGYQTGQQGGQQQAGYPGGGYTGQPTIH